MYTVLTTAKTMNFTPVERNFEATQPHFLNQAEILVRAVRRLNLATIRELMKISEPLARQTAASFRQFETPFTEANAKPAIFSFAGDVYRSFEADTADPADLEWAQEHLGIVSGLFGLLRPLDLVQAYRLEMAYRLKTRRGPHLYAFWGDLITKRIRALVADHDERTVVSLASAEYLRAVRPQHLGCRIVTPVFLEVKPGEEGRVMAVYAKRARGLMARHIVDNRIDRVEALKDFNAAGYRLQTADSTDETYFFARPFAG